MDTFRINMITYDLPDGWASMTFGEIVKMYFVTSDLRLSDYTAFIEGMTELIQIRKDDMIEVKPGMHIRILPTQVIRDITQ